MTALEIVRQFDKDRFLAGLFLPEDKQRDVMVLYAFNAEVARVPSLVSEPQIGEIRLQWWVDTLEAIGRGEKQDHPLADELAGVVDRHGLPVAALVKLVEARAFDLYADVMPHMGAVEGYFGETDAAMFQLACMIVDPAGARGAAEACGLTGVAFGLARRLKDARFAVAGSVVCRRRLLEAEAEVAKLPAGLRAVFLPLRLVELYLKWDVPSQWRKQWRLWRG